MLGIRSKACQKGKTKGRMIRIRIGQHWRREPGEPPMDSVALELDGVNLLPGAVEEPLAEVVPALLAAVASLHAGRARLAQVSLPEAHLELVLALTQLQRPHQLRALP